MKFIILNILIFTSSLHAGIKENKRDKALLKLVEQEIRHLKRNSKSSSAKTVRLLELYNEKLALFEKVRFSYLENESKTKKHSTRMSSKQLKVFNKAKKLANKALKKRYSKTAKSQIYFILALNERDYNAHKREVYYLKKAMALSSNPGQKYQIRTSLAEYYFNKKNYKACNYQYGIITKNKEDNWYTKNLFNFAWCAFKSQKFNKAVDRLELAYKLSKLKKYIDIREQAQTSLSTFWAQTKNVERAINFIEENSNEKHKSFFSFARSAFGAGLIRDTERLIALSYDNTKAEDIAHNKELLLFEIDFYQKQNNSNKQIEKVVKLAKFKLDDYEKQELQLLIEQEVSHLQLYVKKSFNIETKKYAKSRVSWIAKYFEILTKINNSESTKYLYLLGETYYSVFEDNKAQDQYKKILNIKNMNEYHKKSLDAFYATLERNENIRSSLYKDKLEYIYKKHIQLWKKEQKTQKVYPKLAALYVNRKKFDELLSFLMVYHKALPSLFKEQQKFYFDYIDYITAKKDTIKIASEIKRVQGNFLKLDSKFKKKMEINLTSLLFSRYEEMRQNKNYQAAVDGLKEIYIDSRYGDDIHAQAAFKSGINYIDMNMAPEAIKWLNRSFKIFSKKQIYKKITTIEKMALKSSLAQDNMNSSKIYQILIGLSCERKSDKNNFYLEQIIRNDAANDYHLKVTYHFDKYRGCINNSKPHIQFLTNYYFNTKRFSKLFSLIDKNKELQNKWANLYYFEYPELSYDSSDVLNHSSERKEIKLANSLLKDYNNALDTVQRLNLKIKAPFNPQQFKGEVTRIIKSTQKIDTLHNEVVKTSQPYQIEQSYNEAITLLNMIIKKREDIKIDEFQDKELLTAINKQLNKIYKKIQVKVSDLKRDRKRFNHKNDLIPFQELAFTPLVVAERGL